MYQRRNNRFNKEYLKRYDKIIRRSHHLRPVFDNDSCNDFIKNISKDAENSCRDYNYSL
jgi:hypothetical protein